MQRFRTIVIAGDFQYPYHDPKVVKGFLKFLHKIQPQEVILNGDVMDFYALSKYDHNPDRLGRLQEELDGCKREILRPLREGCPRTTIRFTEGNHESRTRRWAWSKAPAAHSLRCMKVPGLLELEKWSITFVPEDRCVQVGKLSVLHGHIVRQHSAMTARAHFQRHGVSMVVNHSHRMGVFYETNMGGAHGVWENGCMCNLKPEHPLYPNWQQGWCTVHVGPNGLFSVQPVIVVDKQWYTYGSRVFRL